MQYRKLLPLLLASTLLASANFATAGDQDKGQTQNNTQSAKEGIIQEIGDALDDMGTTTVIMAKMAKDPLLELFQIKVAAKGDAVTLSGHVDSDMQYQRAVELAQDTKGVKTVDATGISIEKSYHPIDDTIITAAVKAKLYRMALFGDEDGDLWGMKIETNNGTVFVTGEVADEATQQKILNTIKEINSVKNIRSDIRVESH